jgi:hypothetical protein
VRWPGVFTSLVARLLSRDDVPGDPVALSGEIFGTSQANSVADHRTVIAYRSPSIRLWW